MCRTSAGPLRCCREGNRQGHRMEPTPLPQLWELAPAALPADVADEAADLAAAELSQVALLDRLRGSRGMRVRVDVVEGAVVGAVSAVFSDAVVVTTGAGDVVVTTVSLRGVRGARGPAQGPRGRERGSGLTVLREWCGRRVTVRQIAAGLVTGPLHGVGTDHIEVADHLLRWAAVATVSS